MIENRFYKLKRNDNKYSIPAGRNVNFDYLDEITDKNIIMTFEFSYDMAFGEGKHRIHRTGGSTLRKPGEVFSNTFQGKLAEYGMYQYLMKKGLRPQEPDLRVFGEGVWDSTDIECQGSHISIKSTKSYGQLLLLEKDDWDKQGRYIPNIGKECCEYDYLVMIRMKPYCEEILKNNGWLAKEYINKEELKKKLISQKWEYDIPGYINKDDLIHLINNNFVIPKDSILGQYTRMDASNYYAKIYDMRKPDEMIRQIHSNTKN